MGNVSVYYKGTDTPIAFKFFKTKADASQWLEAMNISPIGKEIRTDKKRYGKTYGGI